MVKSKNSAPLSATDFTPLEEKSTTSRRGPSPVILLTTAFTLFAIAVMLFLFAARAVIFRLDPNSATVDLDGLAFHIGDNYLLLKGRAPSSRAGPGLLPTGANY